MAFQTCAAKAIADIVIKLLTEVSWLGVKSGFRLLTIEALVVRVSACLYHLSICVSNT